VFVLKKAGLVEFVLVEVAPDCRRVGRFRVAGHRGVNRVRFRGRVGRRVLRPGTYRITARMRRGPALVDTKLVVVVRANRQEIRTARNANTCSSTPNGQSASSTGSGPGSSSAATTPTSGAKAEKKARQSRDHGVLGARFRNKAVNAVQSIPIWVFLLLGFAIVLLAVAALPLRAAPNRRAALALAHHRGTVALAGATALVAVTVAYTLH
jgi:hypothetical protein